MKNIFDFRNQLIDDYASYVKSFIQVRDRAIDTFVQQRLQEGVLWPEPLIQLNPLFARGESIDELVTQGVLHQECTNIFRKTNPSRMREAARSAYIDTNLRQSVSRRVVLAMCSRLALDLAKVSRILSPL